ncbi:MAG: hypothetical protein V4610_14085 [Pseudomonadota bacterium]|jgi:hypothetical protein
MDKPITFDVSHKVTKSLEKLSADGHKVEVVGQLKDGQLQVNSGALAELSRKFPNAHISFVAVNAPFMGSRT